RESGGIGRRTSLRSWRGTPWGFESPLSHHAAVGCAVAPDPARPPPTSTPLHWRPSINGHPKRMQTTLENLGQLERRLNVAVPLGEIEGEVQKRLANLAKTVRIAGFRPGKVPIKMVAQQYGS